MQMHYSKRYATITVSLYLHQCYELFSVTPEPENTQPQYIQYAVMLTCAGSLAQQAAGS